MLNGYNMGLKLFFSFFFFWSGSDARGTHDRGDCRHRGVTERYVSVLCYQIWSTRYRE